MLSAARSRLGTLVAKPGAAPDEVRRRLILALCILVVVPALACFSANDFLEGRTVEAALQTAMSLVFCGNLALLRWVGDLRTVFRTTAASAVAVLFYVLAVGGGGGYAFVWFYFVPVATLYLFGTREALVWMLLTFSGAALFLVGNVGSHRYELEVGLRFVVTYAITCIVATAIENSRNRYQRELQREKLALEEAMGQIKVLRGILPICAGCKRIRDGAGAWKPVETYLTAHSEALFSHGLCPECLEGYFHDKGGPGRPGVA